MAEQRQRSRQVPVARLEQLERQRLDAVCRRVAAPVSPLRVLHHERVNVVGH